MVNLVELVQRIAADIKGRSPVGHNHDERYYTEAEVNARVAAANFLRGDLWQTSDINALIALADQGRWTVRSTSVPDLPEGAIGFLDVSKEPAGRVIHIFTKAAPGPLIQYSRVYSGGTWGGWDPLTWHRGLHPANRSIDTVLMFGAYGIQSGNTPGLPVNELGTLEVLPVTNLMIQRFTTAETIPRTFLRSYTGTEWNPWPQQSGAETWDTLTGKPETFPPAAHTHDDRYYTEAEIDNRLAALAGIDVPVAVTETGEILVDADYTGQADAAPAIQDAIDRAAALGVGVRLGYGTLRLNSAIIPTTGTQLRGMGMGKTVLRPQGESNAIGTHRYKGDPVLLDIVFEDFDVDGSDQTLPPGGYTPIKTKGIYLQLMRRITMRNLHIHDTGATGLGIDHVTGVIENVWAVRNGRLNNGQGAGGSGIGIGVGWIDQRFEPLTIANCHAEECGRFGIFVEAQTEGLYPSGITITGCTSRGNKDGIGDAGTVGTIITGCHVYENTRSGISIDHGTFSPPGFPGRGTIVANNHLENNQIGILMYAADRGVLHYTRVEGNTVRGSVEDGIRMQINPETRTDMVRYVKIAGNDVFDSGRSGIYLYRMVKPNPLDPIRGVWVTRNRTWNNGQAGSSLNDCGIRISVDSRDLVVDGNMAWDDQDTPTQNRAIAMSGSHNGFVERDNLWRTGTVTLAT